MSVIIYHNPNCGTSRNTLAMIKASGESPEVILYLETPPSRERLRRKGTPYDELTLDDPTLSDDQLIDAMMAHPILINRPIVITPKGAKLCRPSEQVLTLLDRPVAHFVKEDGEHVAYPPT